MLIGELLEVIKKNRKVRKVGNNRIGKDGQKIMLKLGKNLIYLNEVRKRNHALCEKDKKEMICKYDLKKTKKRWFVNIISDI